MLCRPSIFRCFLLGTFSFSLTWKSAALTFTGMRPQGIHAYSSPLFRTSSRIHKRHTIRFSSPSGNTNNDDDNAEPINSEPPPEAASFPSNDSNVTSNTETKKTLNLLERLDYFGQSLKPRAVETKSKLAHAHSRQEKLWLGTQTCLYFSLFILYRAYRGFFVLLPAVFTQVYARMETTMLDDSPFVDEPGAQDVNPTTGKVRWRTRITVSVLAAMVTMTYVIGGVVNVLVKFVKALTQTSSPASSFEAAADETNKYEDKIMKMTSTNKLNVNGTSSGTMDTGLAP